MNTIIKFTPEAEKAIEGLRHSAGTHELYRSTLTRIFNHVLHAAEDIGMDYLEAIETLRVIDMIRQDLAALATIPAPTDDNNIEDSESDDSSRINAPNVDELPYMLNVASMAIKAAIKAFERLPANVTQGLAVCISESLVELSEIQENFEKTIQNSANELHTISRSVGL